jgi:hypothetical protein
VQIFQNRTFVFRATPPPIVVLQTQDYAAAQRTRDSPDMYGIEDMAQVQIACWAWSEPGERPARKLAQASSTRLRTPLQFRSRSWPPRKSKWSSTRIRRVNSQVG